METYQVNNKINDDFKDAQINEFIKVADAINKRLSTQANGGREQGMHEDIFNNTFDLLNKYHNEYQLYNTTGSEDTTANQKKRTELLSKLDIIKNATTQLRGDVLEIGKLAGSENGGNQMSKAMMSTSDIAMTKEILNMDGDWSNVNQYWKDDQIFFDVNIPDEVFNQLPKEEQELGKIRTWSASDIKKNFAVIPSKIEGRILETTTSAIEQGKQSNLGDDFDLQTNADEIIGIIGDDKKAAGHIFKTRQPGQPSKGWNVPGGSSNKWELGSWANALEAHSDLNGTAYKLDSTVKMDIATDLLNTNLLKASDIDGLDGSKPDKVISKEELEVLMTTENRDKIIDVLVNPKNPLYDHKRSIGEFSLWRAKQNEMEYYKNQPGYEEENKLITESSIAQKLKEKYTKR